jgi:hypothetical protein
LDVAHCRLLLCVALAASRPIGDLLAIPSAIAADDLSTTA